MADTVSIEAKSETPSNPRGVLAAVAFAVFVAADDLTVVTTMLRPIINDLGLVLPDGLDDAAWVVNAYLVAFVAVMPIAGRLSDVYGRRRLFMGAYAIFLVGTIVIPLAGSLNVLIVGRVLTAIGGGAMVPVALSVVGDVYPPERRTRALGTLSAIETFGWVWGPLYGAMLVRFFNWQTQFWLNIPMALGGMIWVWSALKDHEPATKPARVNWVGIGLGTLTLVALDLALLGNAEIQSVSGLSELRGGRDFDFRLLGIVAVVAGIAFVWHQRRSDDPVFDPALFNTWGTRIALGINFVVGVGLIVAMVDVPIFINAIELDIETAAVASGWLLSSMTAAMALSSYLGGRAGEGFGHRPVVIGGLLAAGLAYAVMGFTWEPDSARVAMAVMLAVLGFGLGATIAPTTAAVVDVVPASNRGSAAAAVMVVRLVGLSVGLAALTAWALDRFNTLRGEVELPPITDPGYADALIDVQGSLTAQALSETFLATAAVVVVGLIGAFFLRSGSAPTIGGDAVKESPVMETSPTVRSVRSVDTRDVVLYAVLGLLALALVGTVFWISRLSSELEETRTDLNRVEAGAAIYAAQLEGFQTQLVDIEPQLSEGLDSAIEGLDSFATSTIDFTVEVDEVVTIKTDVVIDRTIELPIRETIPIKQNIDTTITIDGPLGVAIPVDVNVPVDLEVPIELDIEIPINETVPVETDIPIKVDVPIAVDVAETELASLTESLAAGLRTLQSLLSGLGG